MNAPIAKFKRGLLSRWLGVSTSGTPEYAPMQLVALEERVLYSAGPIPAEVVDVDLVSQGNFDGVDASDLGFNSFELDATNTLEYLQQQVDAANSLDSIDAIQPLELVPSSLSDGDAVNPGVTEVQAGQLADEAAEVSAAAVASDLQGSERVTAATSAGFDPGFTISGRILHDVNGDGSVDENLGLEGVEVRVYRDLGSGSLSIFDVLAGADLVETTDSNGYYEFTDLLVDETYFIVVSSTTLGEHFELNGLLNAGYSKGDIWGEQTYAAEGALFDRGAGQQVHDGGAFYGGFNAEQSDSAPNLFAVDRFEHVIRRSVTSFDHLDVDFGFSFNVVTNTLGGGFQDDDGDTNRTVQGSLRQFIANANAIAGDNEMRFVPAVDGALTSTTGDSWVIDIENALPAIVDAGTTISGLTYNTDGSLFASPAANVSLNDSVTAGGVDDSLLGPSFRPALTLSGLLNPGNAGLIGEAEFFEVSNLALVNFSTGIVINGEDASNAFIHDNFIGVHADGSQATVTQLNGIVAGNADNGRIFDNYIVDSISTGVLVSGSPGAGDHAEDWRIQNNYIVNENVRGFSTSDGIALTAGTDGAIVFNNRIENSVEFGIDLFNNRGAVTIEGNTIANTGSVRVEDGELVGGAIGLASDGNIVRDNEIIDNNATGILVRGTAVAPGSNFLSATSNLISSNYFESNAGLDIDITRPQDTPFTNANGALDIAAGNGMDALDGGLDPDTGSNGIDHPVLDTVGLVDGALTISGSYLNLISNPQIELYLLGNNDSKRHFATITVADQISYDPTTGMFSAELTEPVGGWPVELAAGSEVAAIIIDGSTSDTSEFSLATSVTAENQPAVFDTVEFVFDAPENSTDVLADFEATDPDEQFGQGVTFSIAGGADADLFTITEDTGELRFVTAQDYENGVGSGPDSDPAALPGNVYSVIVRVEDFQDVGSERDVTVTVTDVAEVAQLQAVAFNQTSGQIDTFTLNAIAVIGPDGFSGDPGTFSYELLEGKDSSAFSFDQNAATFRFNETPFADNPFGNPSIENGIITYSFDVLVTSTNGYTVTETISVTLGGDPSLNAFFVGSETSFFFAENSFGQITNFNSTVPGGGAPTFSIVSGNENGLFSFSGNSGVLSFELPPDFENPNDIDSDPLDNTYLLTVRVQDDQNRGTNRDITVTVLDVNEAPTVSDLTFEPFENTTVVGNVGAVDPEGRPLTYTLSGDDAALFTIDSTGELSFLTAPDFENPGSSNGDNTFSLAVQVEDELDRPAILSVVTVTVKDFNEDANFNAPEADFGIAENSTFVKDFESTDPEGERVTYSISGADADLFTISPRAGILSFIEAPDFENLPASNNLANDEGTYSVVVRAADDQNNGTDRAVTVTVTDFNEDVTFDAPGVDEFFVVENTTAVADFDATDPENLAVNFSISGADAALFTLDRETGILSFIEAPDFENLPASNNLANDEGTYSVVVRAADDQNNGTDREVTVTVTGFNEAPTFDTPEADFSIAENSTFVNDFESSDPEGVSVNYSISGADADLFTISQSDGELEFKTAPDFENLTASNDQDNDRGTYSLVVRVEDDQNRGTNRDVTVTVTDVPEIATLDNRSFTQLENEIVSHQLEPEAEDGSEFNRFEFSGDSSTINFDETTGEFSFLIAPDFDFPTDGNGDNIHLFTVTAISDTGFTVTEEIDLTVVNVVETVDFGTTEFFTNENTLTSFAFDAIASDGSELNYSIVGGDDFSAIQLSSDATQFNLLDLPNFEVPTDFDGNNAYEFTVRAESDTGIDVTQEIRVHVLDNVETVLAVDDSGVVDEGGTVQVDVLGNDEVDPLDRLDVVEVVNVSNGTASFNSAGELEFVHDGTDTTSAEVTYRIVNQEGDISSASVNIVVNPVMDLARTENDSLEIASAQGSFSVNVVANDSVVDASLTDFRVQIVEGPSQGTVAVDGVSGNVVFTPFANFNGVDSFQYQLVSSDGQQVLSDIGSVSVELTQDTPDLNLPTQDVDPIVENNEEVGSPEVVGLDRSVNPPEDEREEGIPPNIVLTADPIVAGQGYVTPDDLSSDGARIGLSLEFEGNVYTYLGRTQFLDLANLELSEFELRDSIKGEANQNNQILLSQLIVGVSNMGSSDRADAPGLSVGGGILQAAPFMGVLAGCVGLTTLTVTGSQMYRTLDVGSLLTDDESIEDIISS